MDSSACCGIVWLKEERLLLEFLLSRRRWKGSSGIFSAGHSVWNIVARGGGGAL